MSGKGEEKNSNRKFEVKRGKQGKNAPKKAHQNRDFFRCVTAKFFNPSMNGDKFVTFTFVIFIY